MSLILFVTDVKSPLIRCLIVSWMMTFLTVSLGCQSRPTSTFNDLTSGMEKSDVLARMGSPERTQRWKGQDRWTYIFYDEDQRQEKEVHFLEGRVVYLGPAKKPTISAEEQDRINEESNQKIEKQVLQKRMQDQQALRRFEEKVKGTDQIRPSPQFRTVQ